MKAAAIALAALSLASAGAATASDHMNDMDYLRANRCRGLAAGLNVGDVTSLDARLKVEARTRSEPILLRGQDEFSRARRDAERAGYKERLTAELNGPCMAYLSGAKDTSAAR